MRMRSAIEDLAAATVCLVTTPTAVAVVRLAMSHCYQSAVGF